MNNLADFLKQLRLGKILAAVLATFVLFTTTACNNPSNDLGARPQNPPVQMGGSNNPYKGGGDGYTDYKMSTDRAATNKRASLGNGQLIATSGGTELQYPGTEDSGATGAGRNQDKIRQEMVKDAQRIPAEPQNVIDRSDPNERILEKTGQAFQDASSFLKDSGKEAVDRPLVQPNPNQPHANRSNPNR